MPKYAKMQPSPLTNSPMKRHKNGLTSNSFLEINTEPPSASSTSTFPRSFAGAHTPPALELSAIFASLKKEVSPQESVVLKQLQGKLRIPMYVRERLNCAQKLPLLLKR